MRRQKLGSMLEYYKVVLRKVSFDPQLFKKEFYKAIYYDLLEPEVKELELWIKHNFSKKLVDATLSEQEFAIA